MPGARCTRGLACNRQQVKTHTSIQVSGGNPTFPAQWFYGLYRALLGERIRLVTVAAGLIADRPGWIDFATDSLAPATGVGTTRFCRTQQRRSSCAPVLRSQAEARPAIPIAPNAAASTTSHPGSVTIAIRPSWGMRRAGI